MNDTRTFDIKASGDREIVMTRPLDAPRDLVWDAWTKPELLKRWLGVFGGNTLEVCEIDLQPGGKYRYVWRASDGSEMGVGGIFREVVRPERIVNTELFDEPWYEGENVITTTFVEKDGVTTATITLHFESQKIRDGVLDSPMADGVRQSYDALARLLADQQRINRAT